MKNEEFLTRVGMTKIVMKQAGVVHNTKSQQNN